MNKLTPAAVAIAAAILATPAAATSVAVQLNLLAGAGNRQIRACRITHHYTLYKAGAHITMTGTVAPAPAGSWEVKVKMKKCIDGQFRTVWSSHVLGAAGGSFRASYRARRVGSFFARAYYYGVTPVAQSDKQFFRVS